MAINYERIKNIKFRDLEKRCSMIVFYSEVEKEATASIRAKIPPDNGPRDMSRCHTAVDGKLSPGGRYGVS